MKYHLTVLAALVLTGLIACKNEAPKDYAQISGKIENHLGKDGSLSTKDGYSKTIKIAPDGTFSDTVHVGKEGKIFSFSDGNEVTKLFLKDGYDLKLTLNTDQFDETVHYEGKGAINSNFLAENFLLSEKLMDPQIIMTLDEDAFNQKINQTVDSLKAFLASHEKNLDPLLVRLEKEEIGKMKKSMLGMFNFIHKQQEVANKLKGKPSPGFAPIENYAGGKTGLEDLKGKYAYIDVWATWCAPCRAEIPHLKKLEEQFKGKNINFVSISVDKPEDHDAWRKMVKEKQMSGIQLIADEDWEKSFSDKYSIQSIPRFILLDPNGIIIDADMSRPSDPQTAKRLAKLLK